MSKNSSVWNFIKNPLYLWSLIIGLFFLGFVFFSLFHKENTNLPQIKENQIQIVKGDEVITIDQNGLVEYKSKERSYYETWDSTQINLFFSMMEKKARDYLGRKVSGGDCGYKVFMFIDNKLVSVCIDSADKEMSETVEPIFIEYSDVSLTDYFDGDTDPEDSGDADDVFDGVINFPTSTPFFSQATPTPYSIYNIDSNYAPVEANCDTWGGSIVRNRAIISNTYCTVQATPTPVQ
jgi:hypothetical protein